MKLSILIPTTVDRRPMFDKLYAEFLRQKSELYKPDDVEILYEEDNKEISVGAKRQLLLNRSKGKYVVQFDSDDQPSFHYIKMILKAAEGNPDCIGFLIRCNMEGKMCMAKASNKYDDWADNVDGFRYVRTIYHKTPVLRSIAIRIGFKDLRYAEDYDYAKRLKESGRLVKEVFINEVLYHYNYTYQDPKIKYGITN